MSFVVEKRTKNKEQRTKRKEKREKRKEKRAKRKEKRELNNTIELFILRSELVGSLSEQFSVISKEPKATRNHI